MNLFDLIKTIIYLLILGTTTKTIHNVTGFFIKKYSSEKGLESEKKKQIELLTGLSLDEIFDNIQLKQARYNKIASKYDEISTDIKQFIFSTIIAYLLLLQPLTYYNTTINQLFIQLYILSTLSNIVVGFIVYFINTKLENKRIVEYYKNQKECNCDNCRELRGEKIDDKSDDSESDTTNN